MPNIERFHIRKFEEQGCESWDEYCNQNNLNYDDLYEDEEDAENTGYEDDIEGF